ncbi:MAG TPA: hydrogenase maturation protease, partial [Polyangiaceae bacterium]|nr:hydrogenase maturation protease [Polyangiaceae bacterium]
MGATAPLLVFGVGNPARGDDALGPLFIERLGEALSSEVAGGGLELLTDYQLQIEHALDLTGRSRVVFVDASTRAAPPFEFLPVAAQADNAFTTHALSPGAVLATHEKLGGAAPESWVLAIRGERFELGDPLTARAKAHLDAALEFFVADARGLLHETAGRRLEVEGTVQGVGFRPWIYRLATGLGLSGEVYNTASGVTIEAFGGVQALDALVSAIQREAPAAARILALRATPIPLREASGFRIRSSVNSGQPSLTLPPDLATCDACLADVHDRASRYHGYALTSCMECGPRFAIASSLPYDRET